jgi:TM2 domain-containing membrane protein YozV
MSETDKANPPASPKPPTTSAPSKPPSKASESSEGSKTDTPKPSGGASGMYESTSLKRWQAQNLDYNYYWAFTVFLGWLGIDYWYLGAPLTGLLKLIVNLFTFGYWWFYDVLNATFNRPTVELFGPTMPFFGTIGCAGGRFRQADGSTPKDKLDKHLNYIIYGLVLGFFGIFGADSYLIGNTFNAFLRLIFLVTFIGIPIALIWWIVNIYEYVFNPNYFIDDAWIYLGAPPPAGDPCPSIFRSIIKFFTAFIQPIIGMIFGFQLPLPVASLDQVKEALLNKPSLTPPEVQKLSKAYFPPAKGLFGGGGEQPTLSNTNTHLLSLLFAGTIGFIVVSSIVLSLRRSYQNGNKKSSTGKTDDEQRGDQENDDVPPQPRVSGVTPKNA